MDKILTFNPLPDDSGKRIDLFLTEKIKDITRSHVKELIEEGFVTIRSLPVKASAKTKTDEAIQVILKEKKPLNATPQKIPLNIIYEDPHLIVLDKQAGMVVHPAPGNPDNTLVNALLSHCSSLSSTDSPLRPGIVHRLDKGTSGVMMVAKNDAVHLAISKAFKEHSIKKEYLAIVLGTPARKHFTIETLFGRDPKNRKKMTGKVSKGKVAFSKVELLEKLKEFSYLKVAILTGRTHQIRVHLAEMNLPIAGDHLYFKKGLLSKIKNEHILSVVNSLERPLLHSFHLEFYHPVLKRQMLFDCKPPKDFLDVLNTMRDYGRDSTD